MTGPLDLLNRAEAAKFLRCSVGRLRTGWGPRPLPAYLPRILFLRRDLERFLENQCEFTNEPVQPSGGSASSGTATPTQSQREREIAERLRRSPPVGARRSKPVDHLTSAGEEERG